MVSRSNRILGLILAGGQGSRMGGVDKGMIEHKGQPLIELVLERLKPQCDEVVISANRNLAEYRKLKLKVLPDESSDTYDSIDWLIKNVAHHNGRVGQWGISYPGFYTAAAIPEAHPALVASSPQAPISDFYFDDFHHICLLYTSPSPRDLSTSRMPSSA